MKVWRRIAASSGILFYLLVAVEVIVMVTPFTAYFYSLYAPVLTRLESNPWTSWLTAFFLPHISYSGDPLIVTLAYMGPVLFALGMIIFFVCAAQVYSAKLVKRGVVSGGLYSYVRHPQYLGLSIAGLGLLLFWPRFLILITFVTMLFLYYLLASNEEARMESSYGDSYRQYMEKIPMFLPGNPGERLFALIFGRGRNKGLAIAALYLIVLGGGLGLAFGLRAYSGLKVPILVADEAVAVSLTPSSPSEMKQVLSSALGDARVAELLARYHKDGQHTHVAYILPQDYMMQHLLADISEHEEHHGRGAKTGLIPVAVHLGEMFLLKPLRQLKDGRSAEQIRIIFAEARTARGYHVPGRAALGPRALRYPLFFVDLDRGRGNVTLTMETPRRHAWGTIPVPAF